MSRKSFPSKCSAGKVSVSWAHLAEANELEIRVTDTGSLAGTARTGPNKAASIPADNLLRML